MMNWKYLDKTHEIVVRGNESALASKHQQYLDWLAEGNVTEMEDAIPLPEVKLKRKAKINAEAQTIILNKYPLWVQANCANGVYPSTFATQMRADIAAVIVAANIATDAVSLAIDEAGVMAITVTWPVI